MRTALTISATAHALAVAGALIWGSLRPRDRSPADLETVSVEIIAAPAPTPTPLLDRDPARQIEPSRQPEVVQPATAIPTSRAPRITAGVATESPERAVADPPPGQPPNRWFDMRRPQLDPSTRIRNRFDALDHVPAGTDAQRDIVTGELSPAGGGTMRSNQGPFVARVDRDGSVDLKDTKNFRIRLHVPSAKQIGDVISDWYYDPNKPVGFLGPMNPEGASRPEGNDKGKDKDGLVPVVSGSFDVSDAFMRRHGQDPYASKKLKFLDSTRDERAQIGARHREKQLADAEQLVKRNLDRLWAQTPDPEARRQALFEMWDECAETGTADLVEAGTAARRMIIGFIRTRLPAGAAGAYSGDQLARLNRSKRSTAVFSPY